MALSLSEKIVQQEKIAAEVRKKISDLKQKAKLAEAKRFTRIAEKCGYFDIEISDEELTNAIEQLVKSVGSSQEGSSSDHSSIDVNQSSVDQVS